MAALTHRSLRAVRRRPSKARHTFADALRSAIEESGASKAAAARWLGIGERTLYNWLHELVKIDWEIVIDCPQLGERFLRHVCAHKNAPAAVGYIARKRKRARGKR